MNNGFDKKAYKRSISRWKFCYRILIVTSLISMTIAAVVVFITIFGNTTESPDQDQSQTQSGISIEDNFGEDPKDYYGSYYGVKDYAVYQVDITDEKATFVTSDAYDKQTEVFLYKYSSPEYSKGLLGKECAALLFYTDSVENAKLYLWINSDGSLSSDSISFTTTPVTFESLMNDPKDYYGTYYSNINYTIDKISITETGAEISKSNAIIESDAKSYKYIFLCAEYAKTKYGVNAAALVIYENDIHNAVKVLYFSDDDSFVTKDGYKYSTEELTIDKMTDDPKNYYGDYVYSEGNSVTVNEDGTAVFSLNGEATKYEYFYANTGWLLAHMNQNLKDSLVLHNNSENNLQIFTFIEDGNLVYGGEYIFEKQ